MKFDPSQKSTLQKKITIQKSSKSPRKMQQHLTNQYQYFNNLPIKKSAKLKVAEVAQSQDIKKFQNNFLRD